MTRVSLPWLLSMSIAIATSSMLSCSDAEQPQATAPQASGAAGNSVAMVAAAGMSAPAANTAGKPASTATMPAVAGSAGKPAPAAGMGAGPAGSAAPASAGAGATAGPSGSGGSPAMTAADAGMPPPAAGAGAMPMTGAILPAVDSVDADGKFATAPENLSSGPGGTSGVFRPMELGKDGLKHPIFIWSCGGGTTPSMYVWHMNRIASHGFVVVADDAPNDASGSKLVASMDWIVKENDREGSDFYQKLDTNRIGIGGHSMGALNTLTASADPRVKASVLVCGGGGGNAGAAKFHSPSIYLGGVGEMGTANFEGDYEETPAPTVFLIKEDTDHIYCARNNMAPWVGFLRWVLAGDDKYKTDFTDMSGTYCKSPWQCRSKNW